MPDAAAVARRAALSADRVRARLRGDADVYERLLDAWARAGYVVAAPSFPLTQKHVPGGRRERDLVNQPGDMSFVISRMLADDANPASFLHGLIAAA